MAGGAGAARAPERSRGGRAGRGERRGRGLGGDGGGSGGGRRRAALSRDSRPDLRRGGEDLREAGRSCRRGRQPLPGGRAQRQRRRQEEGGGAVREPGRAHSSLCWSAGRARAARAQGLLFPARGAPTPGPPPQASPPHPQCHGAGHTPHTLAPATRPPRRAHVRSRRRGHHASCPLPPSLKSPRWPLRHCRARRASLEQNEPQGLRIDSPIFLFPYWVGAARRDRASPQP